MVTHGKEGDEVTFGQDVGYAFRRFWWLIVLGAVGALVIGYLLTPEQPLTTSFRATVLIPGDTEDTGSSERPELMVLDDLGPFVESWAFAEIVAGAMEGDAATEEVYGMLEGSRYSRIATVEVAGTDASFVLDVAEAAAEVFPQGVKDFLVAAGSPDASVQIIDPPREATTDATMRWIRIGAIGLLGAASASVLAVLLSPGQRRVDLSNGS